MRCEYCRSAELLLSGTVDAFTIVFQPGAFSSLFQLPAVELTNSDFDGEEVLGRSIGELYTRLGEVSAFDDRVRVADRWLSAVRPASESVSASMRLVAESPTDWDAAPRRALAECDSP